MNYDDVMEAPHKPIPKDHVEEEVKAFWKRGYWRGAEELRFVLRNLY